MVLAVERGELSAADACARHEMSPATYFRWKRRFRAGTATAAERIRALEARIHELERISQKRSHELDALRALVRERWPTVDERRRIAARLITRFRISERRACALTGIARAVFRYRPRRREGSHEPARGSHCSWTES